MIGILDIDMGNLRSVSKAIYSLGYDDVFVRSEKDFEHLTHLIIPGVGNFANASAQLDRMDLRPSIQAFYESGRPIMGICLGMQLLAEYGEEGGLTHGLGLVPGRVCRMHTEGDHPLPHVGWNEVKILSKHPVLKGVKDGVDFYFVHSYHFICEQEKNIIGVTDYGCSVNAIVANRNVIGLQFHPEKSQGNGLKILDNFCGWDGLC